MIKIEELSLLSFLLTFQDHRTAYSDICAKEAAEKGVLLAAEYNGVPAGYICASYDTQTLLITYAYTVEQYRCRGVFSALMKRLSEMTECIHLRLSVKPDHQYFTAIEGVCLKNGFIQTDTVKTYICKNEGLARQNWSDYMERHGNRLCETLKRQGYEVLSFEKCSKELLSQVYYSPLTEYSNSLDPRPFFDVKAKNLLYDMSYVAMRNGKLSAYVLTAGTGSGTVIFEHISVSAEELGGGAVILPFCTAMSSFFEREFKIASYAMYDSNKSAGSFRKRVLSVFDTRVSSVQNYCRYPIKTMEE